MNLSQSQKERLAHFIPLYKHYTESSIYREDGEIRRQRQALFESLLSPEAIDELTELEFGRVISALWASQMWGNKSYLVDKLVQENGLPILKSQMKVLLWGEGDIAARFDAFRRSVKGFGTATIAEILAFVHPDCFGVWNDRARVALKQLNLDTLLPFINKSQLKGQDYQRFNEVLSLIVKDLRLAGFTDMDVLGVNYFFFEIWRGVKDGHSLPTAVATDKVPEEKTFQHGEVIEQLIAIGQALGFQTEKEKLVAKGAKVDVVWQARIANLGVVMYVFEVQIHGSIDSLILNLQKAQKNQSVQRLVVAANGKEIEKIRGEIMDLPEGFRRSVSYWDIAEIMRTAALVAELFGVINRLELVKSEFGV